MTDLNLSEGQGFFIGGQRYVVKDGAPVQEAKRGPLGGELVRADEISRVAFNDGPVYLQLISDGANDGDTRRFRYNHKDHLMAPNIINVPIDALLEINVPQQAKGRVMTAGEAAKLPDIVGKTILIKHSVLDGNGSCRPLIAIPESQPKSDIEWHISERTIVEVLD